MISQPDYVAILSNLGPHQPRDLDDILLDPPVIGPPVGIDTAQAHPVTCLTPLADPAISRIGCRVRAPVAHPEQLAARLAAVAVERQVHPIFLSYVADCGMQRFGFRVEHLDGLADDVQAVYEAQLAQFWNLALILDASELSALR